MSSASMPREKRRVGRPRKRDNAENSVDPKQQILRAAAALFQERGIAEVSMLEIAESSGLAQSSLYYWFRRKETIVAELLEQVNRMPIAFAKQLRAEGASPDVQLYRWVRFDVRSIAAFPLEITEVHRVARRDESTFGPYWKARRELTRTLSTLVDEGVSQGLFRPLDASLCALTILAQNESVQTWYPRVVRVQERLLVTDEDTPTVHYDAEEVADFVADCTVAGLLVDGATLDSVRSRVQAQARASSDEVASG